MNQFLKKFHLAILISLFCYQTNYHMGEGFESRDTLNKTSADTKSTRKHSFNQEREEARLSLFDRKTVPAREITAADAAATAAGGDIAPEGFEYKQKPNPSQVEESLKRGINNSFLAGTPFFSNKTIADVDPSLFSLQEISVLTDAQFNKLSEEQKKLVYRQTNNFFIKNPKNFPIDAIKYIPAATIGKLNSEQFAELFSDEQIKAFNPKQILMLTISKTTPNKLKIIENIIFNYSEPRLKFFIEKAPSDFIKNIAKTGLFIKNPKSFPAQYIKDIDFTRINPDIISQLSPEQVKALTTDQIKNFNEEELGELLRNHEKFLNPNQSAISKIKLSNYIFLYHNNFDQVFIKLVDPSLFTLNEIRNLTQTKIDQLSSYPDKIQALKDRIDQLFLQDPKNFPTDAMRHISPETISKLSPEEVTTLTIDQIKNLKPYQLLKLPIKYPSYPSENQDKAFLKILSGYPKEKLELFIKYASNHIGSLARRILNDKQ